MSRFQAIWLVYLEPIGFSILGALPVIADPLAFQAGHAPPSYAPTSLTLANRVVLYQYAALLLLVGLAAMFVQHNALHLEDPTGRSQRRIIAAMQIALCIADSFFASASLVPYIQSGLVDYLNPIKVLTGQVPYIMAPFLGVWVTAGLVAMRVAWLLGFGQHGILDKKIQ